MVSQAGVTDEDIAQVSFGYGMFTGGFGLHYGLERVGATVVPVSSGNTERQLMFMVDFQSTVLISTPSYAAYLAEQVKDRGLKLGEDIHLQLGPVRRRAVDGRHAPSHRRVAGALRHR